ncbi:two-component system response regulator DesR [Streptomyces sp. PvR034]
MRPRTGVMLQEGGFPCDLSGGERRRLDLAPALREEGSTALLTTHHLEQARELTDRLAILHEGELVLSGIPAEVPGLEDDLLVVAEAATGPEAPDARGGRCERGHIPAGRTPGLPDHDREQSRPPREPEAGPERGRAGLRAQDRVGAAAGRGNPGRARRRAVRGTGVGGRRGQRGGSPPTAREAGVLELAADGAPVAEIAERASLAQGTVRNHLASAAAELGAENRHTAVRLTRARGWV